MADSKFECILDGLPVPQDSKSLFKLLVNIRKEVEWPKDTQNILKIRSKGSLNQLVTILHMPQRYILDVCLSILGNCIMDKGCARDLVGIYNILSPLNLILKHHPKEDSINGRVFRIIGNMCQHKKDQWANLVIDSKPHIVTHIVDLLKKNAGDSLPSDEKYSEATLAMAVRTLRLLLNSRTVIPLVKNFGVLKTVGLLFIKTTKEWQESKVKENLLIHIIRLLHDYSRYKYYNSILELVNTSGGNSLLHLSEVLFIAPKNIVKIVMNFIKVSQLTSELPVTEICDKFVDEIQRKYLNSEDPNEYYLEYIQCICHLLEHPSNRNIERCGKCIPLLIQVLDSFKEPTAVQLKCCILLVITLNLCQFDDSLIQEQLKHNIIDVLLRKLQWVIGASYQLNVEHKMVKRKSASKKRSNRGCQRADVKKKKSIDTSPDAFRASIVIVFVFPKILIITAVIFQQPRLSSPCSPSSTSSGFVDDVSGASGYRPQRASASPSGSDDDFSMQRFDRSPSPCSSIASDMATFQALSPCGSPASYTNEEEGSESDSDDYSPVCSDVESEKKCSDDSDEEEMEEVKEDGNEQVSDVVEEIESDNEPEVVNSGSAPEETNIANMKILLITEIAILIGSFVRVNPIIPQLGSEELLIALLKCSSHFKNAMSSEVNTIQIILRILDSAEYLIPLMKTTFIESIYNLTRVQHNENCNSCMDYMLLGKIILRQITSLAESGAGSGDIAYALKRGNDELKQQMVLVIPYIMKNESLLAKYMVQCNGLDILIKLLQTDTDLKKRAIKTVCALATHKLGIANPRDVVIQSNRSKVIRDKYKLTDECANRVTFKLDDGSIVQADRAFLSEKSDFFRGLLTGHFRESTEDEIRLHNVKKKSLRCLLQILKCLGNKLETVDIKQDLETLLDTLTLSDRYLLNDVCDAIVNSIERFRLNARNVSMIYRWSLESGTNLLRVESVAFALVADVLESERLKMFQNLFDLGYTGELIDDIRKLLDRYLNILSKA